MTDQDRIQQTLEQQLRLEGVSHVNLTSVNNPRHPLIPAILERLKA